MFECVYILCASLKVIGTEKGDCVTESMGCSSRQHIFQGIKEDFDLTVFAHTNKVSGLQNKIGPH